MAQNPAIEHCPSQLIRLSYLADAPLYRREKPFRLTSMNSESRFFAVSNLEWDEHKDISLHNVRGVEDKFTLEDDGFCWMQHKADSYNLATDNGMRAYMGATLDLFKGMFPGARIVCYDYRLRSNVPMDYEQLASTSRTNPAPPVTEVHIDHSNNGGFQRARRHLTAEESKEYLDSGSYRIRIINSWQPCIYVIEDSPLALCHPKSVDYHDLMPTDRVAPEFLGELWHPKYSAQHQWCWLRRQQADELCAFVQFDSLSAKTQQVRAVPHSAFHDPSTRYDAPPRQSVETRMLVISPCSDGTA